MRANLILIALSVLLNSNFVQASNSYTPSSAPDTTSTPTPPPPPPGPNPINELIEQLQALNSNVAALNETIRNEAQMIGARWNQSNVEFKEGVDMADKRLAPLSLLQIGAFIGLPLAVAEVAGLSVLYCIMRKAQGYHKLINSEV